MRKWWNGIKDKPVTWGRYVKLCKWSFIVSLLIMVPYWLWICWDYIPKPKFGKKYATPETEDEDILI